MDTTDPAGYAELWLSELGAHVPELHAAAWTYEERVAQFGLHLPAADRARRHARSLELERLRARSDAAAARA